MATAISHRLCVATTRAMMVMARRAARDARRGDGAPVLRSPIVTTYDVRCPGYGRRAAAAMVPHGPKGTYREAGIGMRCQRITCIQCGLIRELTPERGQEFEFWYRTSVRGHTVWATTRKHLDFLVAWMTSQVDERDLPWWDASLIEPLPSWRKEHRGEAAAALRALPHD